MTCIVGLEYDGKVYMGGDSEAASGWDMTVVDSPKVFKNDKFLIGYTSSFRMGQLLEYTLDVPENKLDDDKKYLITEFIPAVRSCLKDGAYTKIENNQESGGFFLLGYNKKLYEVAENFQVLRTTSGFLSIGAGSSYALGAMDILRTRNMSPEDALLWALRTAGKFSNGVCSPYYVYSL